MKRLPPSVGGVLVLLAILAGLLAWAKIMEAGEDPCAECPGRLEREREAL